MTVSELFQIATGRGTRGERRNAFRQLRELSFRGEKEVAVEARFALEHSEQYEHRLDKRQKGQNNDDNKCKEGTTEN